MKNLNWTASLSEYIRKPSFASYGSSVETRPVLVDCSLGSSPLNLYPESLKVELAPASYTSYPADGHRYEHLSRLVRARFSQVTAEELIFGAGSQGTIYSISRTLGGAGTEVLCYLPTFIPALMEFENVGARLRRVPLKAPYGINVQDLAASLNNDTTLLYLDNPNNPTGQAVPLDQLDWLAQRCADNGTLLMVDEAYGDFLEDSESTLNLTHDNLITTRSFSKGCGLAGVRVGYTVIRNPELRKYYLQTGLLFSISAAAADVTAAALEQLDFADMRRRASTLKKNVLNLIAQYPQFTVAPTSEATIILMLTWSDASDQNLYDKLMDGGIMTEGGVYFNLPDNNVRLRVPPENKWEEFQTRWRGLFDK